MSKISDFITKEKIDPRRVLSASKTIEGLRPKDRAIRLARGRVRKGKPSEAETELAAQEARSGKAVTKPLFDRVLSGETVSSKARGRVLRAINHILVSKKKDAVKLEDLF